MPIERALPRRFPRRRPDGLRAGLAAALLAAILVACTPQQTTVGHIPRESELTELRPGVHDKASVRELLGSPTSLADFEGETWIYVERTSQRIAFFEEEVLSQKVVVVAFDDLGVLKTVNRYALEDGRPIVPIERETPTRGKELTFLQQMFGNFGRFNNSGGQ